MCSSSLSTSAYYNGAGDDKDTADSAIARILLSLSSPSTFSLPRRNFPLVPWSTKKKRLFCRFDSLQSKTGRNIDGLAKELKAKYRSNKRIVAGIEAFQFLRSQGLNGDQMLKVLDAVCNNGANKRKIDVNLKENPAPVMMIKKQKIDEESAKFKNLSELIGEGDDLKGSVNGNYECKECKVVFSSSQALGGHTASHNRKKKIEEVVLLQTSSDLTETAPAGGNGGGRGSSSGLVADGDQKNCVYKCNLCPKSFSTGQALGGHKTYHRETDIGIHEKKGSSGELQEKNIRFDIDLNVIPEDQNLSQFSAFVRQTCFC